VASLTRHRNSSIDGSVRLAIFPEQLAQRAAQE